MKSDGLPPFSTTLKYQTLSPEQRRASGPGSERFKWFTKHMEKRVEKLIKDVNEEDTTQ